MFLIGQVLVELADDLDEAVLYLLPLEHLQALGLELLLRIVFWRLDKDLRLHVRKDPPPLVQVVFAVIQFEGHVGQNQLETGYHTLAEVGGTRFAWRPRGFLGFRVELEPWDNSLGQLFSLFSQLPNLVVFILIGVVYEKQLREHA